MECLWLSERDRFAVHISSTCTRCDNSIHSHMHVAKLQTMTTNLIHKLRATTECGY